MTVRPEAALAWTPPASYRRLRTIDAHTGGEPFRLLIEGGPEIPGETMLARRRWAEEHADPLRRLLMWEPRGHADMYGCLLTEPVTPEGDFGVLFMHNAGFSTMCGHGTIAAVKVALDTGMLERPDGAVAVAIDTPAGAVAARAEKRRGVTGAVTFRNVPSFALELDAEVEVEGIGEVRYDLAFGGAFYAFVDAAAVGLGCTPERYGELVRAGRRIGRAVTRSRPIDHPDAADLGFLYGVVFLGPTAAAGRHGRHVAVFADGEVDRSPTGTAVSARLAVERARGAIEPGEERIVESIVGSVFRGRIVDETTCGPHPAVVPEIEGRAAICGRHELLLAPDDDFPEGFFLR